MVVQRRAADRLRQVVLFEGFGVVLMLPFLMAMSGQGAGQSATLLVLLSGVAMAWTALFNTGFDRAEGRLAGRRADRRPWRWRVVHAGTLELSLILVTWPVILLMTPMNWLDALLLDVHIALGYAIYAFVFNIIYDRLFPVAAVG